ncbi:hypothetical protein GOBAR_DD12439 [Gossypium barbadense]|nr:hypothetical protein GOBAR_DD12439 [Gossypium barbadense]
MACIKGYPWPDLHLMVDCVVFSIRKGTQVGSSSNEHVHQISVESLCQSKQRTSLEVRAPPAFESLWTPKENPYKRILVAFLLCFAYIFFC